MDSDCFLPILAIIVVILLIVGLIFGAVYDTQRINARKNWYAAHSYVEISDPNIGTLYIKIEDIPKLAEVKVEK